MQVYQAVLGSHGFRIELQAPRHGRGGRGIPGTGVQRDTGEREEPAALRPSGLDPAGGDHVTPAPLHDPQDRGPVPLHERARLPARAHP